MKNLEMVGRKIGGIDIGTTGCKISIYSIEGALLREVYREHEIHSFVQDGIECHEIQAEHIYLNIIKMLREIGPDCEGLEAIGIASFGETAVLLDKRDQPLRPAILYTDPRGKEQCDKIQGHFGKEYIAKITGHSPHGMYTLPKVLYIKEKWPELFAKTARIMLIQDYITYMLTGIAQIDYSMACRSMMLDIDKLDWDEKLLTYAGIDKEMLSRPVAIGTIAGEIKSGILREMGLWDGTGKHNHHIKIVSVAQDQVAAAIGGGVLAPGMAVDGAGTVQCVTPFLEKRPPWEKMIAGGYSIVPYLNKSYVTYAYSFAGGALLKWYRRQINNQPYDILNNSVTKGPSGLLVLPHFSGAATPYMNPEATGAILGLKTTTTSQDIYKALMEGVAFEMLLNINYLKKADISIKGLYATGGGALSAPWLQIKANILNMPITTMGAAQAGTLGCVMMAGVACGVYGSLNQAKEIFVHYEKVYEPEGAYREAYQRLYAKYEKVYEAVGGVMGFA